MPIPDNMFSDASEECQEKILQIRKAHSDAHNIYVLVASEYLDNDNPLEKHSFSAETNKLRELFDYLEECALEKF